MAEADADEEDDEDPNVKAANSLARGKHYTVFSFQNWSGKHKQIHFVVARYALKKHPSRWLRKANCSVVSFLGSFHIYCVGNAYDGASENRLWTKKTLKITLRELLSDVLQSENGSSSSTESDNGFGGERGYVFSAKVN